MRFALSCFFLVLSISIFFLSSVGQSLFPNQTIISKQGKFELGFFTPANSSNYYVGIWYKTIPVQTVVWVLNRNHPITSSFRDSCLLQISSGSLNLIVNSEVIWRSAVSLYVTEAAILDTGNFVLRNASGILWQSFDNPTDTWLPGATVGFNFSYVEEAKLVSWRTVNDPAIGEYSLGMEPNRGSELFLKNGTGIEWRSGIWQGGTLPAFTSVSRLYNFSFVSKEDSAFLAYNVNNGSLVVRVVLEYDGTLRHLLWSEERQQWLLIATQPTNVCNTFAICGANAICDIESSPVCHCLRGFVPLATREWNAFDFSRGCIRTRPLQCDVDRTSFMEVGNINFPLATLNL